MSENEPIIVETENQEIENNVETTVKDTAQASSQRDWEAEARTMGWTDKFKGDPTKFIDAKTFVEKGENEIGLIKADVRKLQGVTKEKDEFIKRIAEDNARIRQELDKARQKEVDKSLHQAFEDGDKERYDQAIKERDEFIKSQKEYEIKNSQPEPVNNNVPTEIVNWVENNPAYKTDENYRRRTDAEFRYICDLNPNNTIQQNLDLLTEKISAINNKPKFNAVGGSQTPIINGDRKKSFNDLPELEKDICRKYVKNGTFKDTQGYVDIYFNQ
jgi:hypothetical protein